NLRADARGMSAGLLDEHTFDQLAVVQSQQEFVGVITGMEVAGDLSLQRLESFFQCLPKLAREIGHLFERLGSPEEDPALDAAPPHPALASSLEPVIHVVSRYAEKATHSQ